MVLEYGNMWDIFGKTDLFIVTTNSFLRRNGSVVMGKGIALAACTRVPNIDFQFGRMIAETCGHLGEYGLLLWKRRSGLTVIPEGQSVAAFQVKRHFQDKADVNLISISSLMLKQLAEKYHKHRFDLNFPGIGNGKLTVEEVLPIISALPDNVHVWKFK